MNEVFFLRVPFVLFCNEIGQQQKVWLVSRTKFAKKMDYSKVQRRAQRAINDRMLERYPMSNSDLFSSADDSSDDDISDLIYRNLRFKSPMELPFRMDNFVDGVPVSCRPTENRPKSVSACAKCNQIRTNPRFRPSSFHCYGKLQSELRFCESDSDSSEDDIKVSQRKSFSNKRRRPRTKSR